MYFQLFFLKKNHIYKRLWKNIYINYTSIQRKKVFLKSLLLCSPTHPRNKRNKRLYSKLCMDAFFSRETQLKQRTVRKRWPSYMKKDCNFMNVEFKFLRMKRKRKVHFFTKHGGLTSVDSQFDLNHLHFPKGSNFGLIILVDSWFFFKFDFKASVLQTYTNYTIWSIVTLDKKILSKFSLYISACMLNID